jgi:hypothetical protein
VAKEIKVPRPGTYFDFASQLQRPGSASLMKGQVLALDGELGVVHVRVLEGAVGAAPSEVIQHLPIIGTRLMASLRSAGGSGEVPLDFRPWLAEWRELNGSGEASAFGVPLGDAMSLIWETVHETMPGATSAKLHIRSAFPVKSPDGVYSSVRVLAFPREP